MSAGPSKVSFGFKKAAAAAPTLPGKAPNTAFEAGGDDEEDDFVRGSKAGPSSLSKAKTGGTSSIRAPSSSSSSRHGISLGGGHAAPASKASRAQAEAALETDSNAFDYDSVYDSMKSSQRVVQQSKQEERSRREAKYVSGMLESQKERNKLLLRAQAKKVQREREAEGDEFAGGEEFVTDAYREQQEELRRVDEEEQQEEERQRQNKKGLSGFYSSIIKDNEAQHQRAMEAAAEATASKRASSQGDKSENNDAEKTDNVPDVVKDARRKGLDVRLNDEGELVDQRDVLSAGLNVIGRSKSNPTHRDGKHSEEDRSRYYGSSGNSDRRGSARDGAAQARRLREEARERSSRAIEDQILELERKKEKESVQEEEERKRKFVGERRNDADKVAEARKRMEERKRRKLEQQQQTEAKSPSS